MEVFMKFITKLGVTCATVAMMASTMSHAAIVSSGQLEDHYVGSNGSTASYDDYTPTYDANYDTHWMNVSRDLQAGTLSVQVNSSFVGYSSVFKLGDLFLMDGYDYNTAASCTAGLDTNARGCKEESYSSNTNKWQYAFDLGLDLGNTNIKNSTSNYNNQTGTLRQLDTSGDVTSTSSNYQQGVNTSSQLANGVRKWQIVDAKSSNQSKGTGTWNTDVGSKLLTMTFDISNTALMNTDQIALRWAMSCANDIIEVVANLKSSKPGDTTAVPEPSTMLLMLLAGIGLFASRKKQASDFKA